MLTFHLITIFPEIFTSYFSQTILSRAQKNKLIKIQIHDLRKFAKPGDAHKSVDDRPYGGGPGMILMVEPIYKALKSLKVIDYKLSPKKKIRNQKSEIRNRIIMLTPAGKKYTQRDAERLSKYKNIILLCGRYEGFDARAEKLVDEKISIGDYVLAGGELPAMVLVETISRQLPGVVGHKHALDEETFSKSLDYIEYPQYSRPEIFSPTTGKKWRVPKVLLSGNHKKIKEWRRTK